MFVLLLLKGGLTPFEYMLGNDIDAGGTSVLEYSSDEALLEVAGIRILAK